MLALRATKEVYVKLGVICQMEEKLKKHQNLSSLHHLHVLSYNLQIEALMHVQIDAYEREPLAFLEILFHPFG